MRKSLSSIWEQLGRLTKKEKKRGLIGRSTQSVPEEPRRWEFVSETRVLVTFCSADVCCCAARTFLQRLLVLMSKHDHGGRSQAGRAPGSRPLAGLRHICAAADNSQHRESDTRGVIFPTRSRMFGGFSSDPGAPAISPSARAAARHPPGRLKGGSAV